MKDLVTTVTSNVAAAGPIPGHGVSLSPSPPHIKPRLTKAALGGIMRRTAPFNYVWSVTFSVFLCHVLTLQPMCEELTGQSRQHPRSLDTSHEGQHQSPASSLGQQSGPCTLTHTHTHNWLKGREQFRCSPPPRSFLKTVSCVSRGRPADQMSTDNEIFITPSWEAVSVSKNSSSKNGNSVIIFSPAKFRSPQNIFWSFAPKQHSSILLDKWNGLGKNIQKKQKKWPGHPRLIWRDVIFIFSKAKIFAVAA